jgi:hypothetical protein
MLEFISDLARRIPTDYDATVVVWKIALGWSILTLIILLLVAVLLDIFRVPLLRPEFRKWIYGAFLAGLLSGISAWFLDVIKIAPKNAAEAITPSALDRAAEQAYVPPRTAPPLPPAPTATVTPSAYRVFVQFAGVLRREDMVTLTRSLAASGWNVQVPDRGGERTSAAAGYNEVRYSSSTSEAAARALAREVQQANLTSRAVTVVRNDTIPPQDLEVWISR